MSYKCKFDLGKVQEFSTAIGPLAFCPGIEINKDIEAEGKMYLLYLTWFGFNVINNFNDYCRLLKGQSYTQWATVRRECEKDWNINRNQSFLSQVFTALP